jgi:hypothetical protein
MSTFNPLSVTTKFRMRAAEDAIVQSIPWPEWAIEVNHWSVVLRNTRTESVTTLVSLLTRSDAERLASHLRDYKQGVVDDHNKRFPNSDDEDDDEKYAWAME